MNNKMYKLMNWPEIEAIVYAESDRPSDILGAHAAGTSTLYQTIVPGAKEVRLRIPDEDKSIKMEQVDEQGFFALLKTGKPVSNYVYIAEYEDGRIEKIYDAYSFCPKLDKKKCTKFASGETEEAYELLGAKQAAFDGVEGTVFSIWAPNARRVSVIGDFNNWDNRVNQMNREDYGIFIIFIPGVKAGSKYLFDIMTKGGNSKKVLDPYAKEAVKEDDIFYSVVAADDEIKWNDKKYMSERGVVKDSTHRVISIYECDLATLAQKSGANYVKIAKELAKQVVDMGYTHVELKPVAEYEAEESLGYETIMYYAPTYRYGKAGEFAEFVNIMHENNIGVILDWTLAHPYGAANALGVLDGTSCYEHSDSRKGIHPQWGTLLFNYNRGEVRSFLKSNAFYWLNNFHIDGLRIDSLASVLCLDYGRNNGEWIANMYGGHENLEAVDFIKDLNASIAKKYPGVLTIAEDSSAWPRVTSSPEEDGLGFTYKWNIGWRDDYLRYIALDPLFRSGSHSDLTLSMLYCYSDRFILPLNGECDKLYDIAPGNEESKEAQLRLSIAYMMMHPGAKLISDKLQNNENESAEISKLIKNLNKMYKEKTFLHELDDSESGFEWINSMDSSRSVLSFMRKGEKEKDFIVVCINFAGIDQTIDIGVPIPGKYSRILNTEWVTYGGLSKIKEDPCYSVDEETDGRLYHITSKLPALSLSVFGYDNFDKSDREYMAKLHEDAIAKAREAKELAEEEERKALKAEKKAEEEQKKAEEALKAAEEARQKAEEMRDLARNEMEKAALAAQKAQEAARRAEIAAHRLKITEESM